jgi:nucleoside-diphosphate-sugar epimerase
MTLNPQNSYGRNKADLELALGEMTGNDSSTVSIIRPFNVFGQGLENSLINRLLGSGRHFREKVSAQPTDSSIGLTRGKNYVRDYVHVSDLSKLVAKLSVIGCVGGTFNCGSGIARTNHDLVRELRLDKGKDFHWQVGADSYSWADMSKTWQHFGTNLSENSVKLSL